MSATIRFPEIRTELPGPNAKRILEGDRQYVSPSYTRSFPLVIERGWGAMIEDVDGNVFLDCNAGVAVCATGHAHPKVVDAISRQASQFIHFAAADYYYPQLVQLGEKLQAATPGKHEKRVHFGNSGAEAVEAAVKIAKYATRREKFIGFYGAFHGRTLGALSFTASKAAQRRGFGRQLLDVTHIPYAHCKRCAYGQQVETCHVECLSVIEDVLFKTTVPPEEVAAIVVEPVLGEGGYIVPPRKFFDQLNYLRDKYGILIIADEVQSGMGRTGRMFACEHFDFVPDIITIAKGIASGLPLSATVARSELMSWHAGAHASTFGGNPVAIAASLATFELLETGLLKNCQLMGDYFIAGLRGLREKFPKHLGDVRGLGLMIGAEIVEGSSSGRANVKLRDKILLECFRRGLVILGCGESALRFSPPLVIDRDQIDCALGILDESMSAAISS